MNTPSFDFSNYENFNDFVKRSGLTETEALLTIIEKIKLFKKELEERQGIRQNGKQSF